MSRSPLWHPMHRGGDMDAGGVADLQTDVMRFMAILAICLVVIFALVQSIPLAPVPTTAPETAPEPVVEPMPEPVAEPVPEPVAEPVTEPVAAQPVVEPTPPAPPVEQQGFTLQFESDLALTRLVERQVIGLYAIGADSSLRMSVSRGRTSFWEASTPNRFHEMDRATVPGSVLQALLRMTEIDPTTVKWGVTLPAAMQQDLNGFLESAPGGSLIIGADGTLRLEP